jgi:hypothetical protein
MSDTVLVGLGDSFIVGHEAGGQMNSFLNLLAKDNDWECLNLGRCAIGNVGSVNHLLLSRKFNTYLNSGKKIIIFWMPTGLGRVDKSNPHWKINGFDLGEAYSTFFPAQTPEDNEIPSFPRLIWNSTAQYIKEIREIMKDETSKKDYDTGFKSDYTKALRRYVSEQTGAQNFYTAWKTLDYVAKAHNIKYYVYPSVDARTNKDNMEKYFPNLPWENYISDVDGAGCMFHWSLAQAGIQITSEVTENGFHTKASLEERERNLAKYPDYDTWIARGYHPTEIAHQVFKEKLKPIVTL